MAGCPASPRCFAALFVLLFVMFLRESRMTD
jgi:hypothetical protein